MSLQFELKTNKKSTEDAKKMTMDNIFGYDDEEEEEEQKIVPKDAKVSKNIG